MLSHAVLSVVEVFPSLWCWVWLVECWECWSFHPSWCEVTMVRFDAVVWARLGMVETVGICQVMWFVMLESTKDWVIGVDTLGQHVPSCVRYGMTCLLIRDVVGSVPCSDESEIGVVTRLGSDSARGAVVPWLPWETLALLWYCDYLS
jgi:hypothetical protein